MKKINYAYVIIQVLIFVVSTILFFAEVNVNNLIFNLVSSILALLFVLMTQKKKEDLLYTCLPVLLIVVSSLFLLLSLKGVSNIIAFFAYAIVGILLLVKTLKNNSKRLWIKVGVTVALYGIAIAAFRVFTVEFLILYVSMATFALVFALSINEYTNEENIKKPNLFYLGSAAFFLMLYTVLFGVSLIAENGALLQTLSMFIVLLNIPSIVLLSITHLIYLERK